MVDSLKSKYIFSKISLPPFFSGPLTIDKINFEKLIFTFRSPAIALTGILTVLNSFFLPIIIPEQPCGMHKLKYPALSEVALTSGSPQSLTHFISALNKC